MALVQQKHHSGIVLGSWPTIPNIADGPINVTDSQGGTWENINWAWNYDNGAQLYRRHNAAAGSLTVTLNADENITFDSPVQAGSTIVLLLTGKVTASYPSSDVECTLLEWSQAEIVLPAATGTSLWNASSIPNTTTTFEPIYSALAQKDGVIFLAVRVKTGTVTVHPAGFTQLGGNTTTFKAYYRVIAAADVVSSALLTSSGATSWSSALAVFEDTAPPDVEVTDNADVCCSEGSPDVLDSGGGQGAGAEPVQTPTIGGSSLGCAGGGLVPTQADLVHAETWW